MKCQQFRLFDFEIINKVDEYDSEYYEGDRRRFIIKMFAMDDKGLTYCIFAKGFQPFFYVKVPDTWMRSTNHLLFKEWFTEQGFSIVSCDIIKKKDLYGFDNNKKYNFMKIVFRNMIEFNKVKNFWYSNHKNFKKRTLLKKGFPFPETGDHLFLYEAVLPPLIRYFHIMNISPSGWATFKKKSLITKIKKSDKTTCCDFEYETKYDNIKSLPLREDAVPMKIMSYDIEASSSHGDFPVPRKTYKKMIGEIIQYWVVHKKKIKKMNVDEKKKLFINLILTAFEYCKIEGISKVYLKNKKKKPSKGELIDKINRSLKYTIYNLIYTYPPNKTEQRWSYIKWERLDDDEKENYKTRDIFIPWTVKKKNILEFLNMKYDAGQKLEILDKAFEYDRNKKLESKRIFLPKLEGDKCTFIGSTFLKLGETEPYYNNMLALGECNRTPEVPNSEVISYENEKDLLLAWTDLVKKEDPDVIIGYNIFGFDWKFMTERAKELRCDYKFLELSRNKEGRCNLIDSTTKVASGTYELLYPKIPGRLQIDLYNYFRKAENLASYKLDHVSSHFIGDIVKDYEVRDNKTIIKSKNLMGLKNGHFICFEILGHSSDKYKDGKKFKIRELDIKKGSFEVDYVIDIEKNKKFRWCLAKDDVTPQDIFRLTNEGPASKAIVAKYCFQDCNLVHNLMNKNDIFTAFVELANICSVPIEFVAMRGQGIKLLSFIAKKCADENTLMPVVIKDKSNEGYEGAICLPPKKGLYKDNPIAVVDYASLYPSSMISENISHDSKVWTKEYDLEGKLIKVWGEKDEDGNFKYDNLDSYKYVDITYDTYKYVRKTKKSAAVKQISGKKTCRFAQFPNNKRAIMPSVLQELLASRKATRKLIKFKTITMKDGKKYEGLLKKTDDKYIILTKNGDISVDKREVDKINDTYNDFMKNVFDKRQLSKKIVANSLYGQCGGKTSSFYDKDIAAATTATGRKLLLFAKKIIEKCFYNRKINTKYGMVMIYAEYIYGDTDSVFFTFNLEDLKGIKIKGKKALEITIELAIQAGKLVSKFLKEPHDLEYEKTFLPFLLLSKKRYVGILYETDPNKCKTKSMGIVLKRRDNAACVKDCYGEVVDLLMNGESEDIAANAVRKYLDNMVNERISHNKLIITKSLNGFYKNPNSMAHKVLADRIAKRDPGNKPSVGSRIPFIYFQTKRRSKKIKMLQGERVEDPTFIRENKLKPDYAFYITNQIMKPVTQIFSLILENLTGFKKTNKELTFNRKLKILTNKYKNDKIKMEEKIMVLRNSIVKELIFADALRKAQNAKDKQTTIKSFFS